MKHICTKIFCKFVCHVWRAINKKLFFHISINISKIVPYYCWFLYATDCDIPSIQLYQKQNNLSRMLLRFWLPVCTLICHFHVFLLEWNRCQCCHPKHCTCFVASEQAGHFNHPPLPPSFSLNYSVPFQLNWYDLFWARLCNLHAESHYICVQIWTFTVWMPYVTQHYMLA